MNGEIDYKRIRARVEQRMKKRRKFLSNLGGMTTATVIIWAVWFLIGGGWPWPLLPMGIFALALIREFLDAFIFSPAMENAYDRAMQHEIARERARLEMGDYTADYDYEKRKRTEKVKRDEPRVRLSDDGELVPVDEDDQAEPDRNARYGTSNE